MKITFFSILLMFASCSQPDDSSKLLNKEWHLELFEDVAGLPAGAHQVPQDDHYVLVMSDTAVRGVVDCNSFTGNYNLQGNRISFSNLAVTEMDCGGNTFQPQFLSALQKAHEYSFKNGTLRIKYDNGKQLVFQTERK